MTVVASGEKVLQRDGFAPAFVFTGYALAVMALCAIPILGSESWIIRGVDILIFVLLASSLNLIVGGAGMISMCHAAFFAIGGYAFGVVQLRSGLDGNVGFLVASSAALTVALLVALVIGILVVRVTQAYFIMLTLALGQLVYVVIWKWHDVTGGDDGLIGIAPPAWLSSTTRFYYFTLAVVLASMALLYQIRRSPFGCTLGALRDNPIRTAYIGVPVRAFRLTAFIIAAGFASIAGILEAMFHRGIFPNAGSFITSADSLVVIVLGGVQAFWGPAIGAVVFKVLTYVLPLLTDYWVGCLGFIILLVALVIPSGLFDLLGRSPHAKGRRP
jgi:branched-chain amino acid transport system permease protein